MPRIDLNCDLGEGFGAYSIGDDEGVLRYVTSANIACGFHAGDPSVMERTVALAASAGVSIGAHPGFPDLLGFGRRELSASADEARAMTLYQIGALGAFAKARGVALTHVKPHGALYNMAAKRADLAAAIAEAVAAYDPALILVGLCGSELLKAGTAAGLRCAGEAFADRAYRADGSLVPRGIPGAVIKDPASCAARAISMATDGFVTALSGERVMLRPDTICLHGDGDGALELAEALSTALREAGVELRPLSHTDA
ncbi:MAG TPA: 5-oxoprolinase subunit PxpA [Spirochaetales bacterium]|nr:5-oxoprolinase subunit PxpA [Spirochaetales bacterium]HPG86894.1 5-oxoprolinase subunit PxpA [Spirochaetales bacterium]HPM72839.1 5-oxoprolinase subunit PxpA [Spirochaetales bacterium]